MNNNKINKTYNKKIRVKNIKKIIYKMKPRKILVIKFTKSLKTYIKVS